MKINYNKIISLLLVFVLLIPCCADVYASEFDCTLEFDEETLSLRLSGTSDSNITVYVYSSSMSPSDFSSLTIPVALWQYDISEETEFEETLALGETMKSGEYIAKAKNARGYATLTFRYFDPQVLKDAIDAINLSAKESPEAVVNTLYEYSEDLFLEKEKIDKAAPVVGHMIYSRKIVFEEVEKLRDIIDEAIAVSTLISADDETFENALDEVSDVLGLDKEKYYEVLSEDAKKLLSQILKEEDWYKTGVLRENFGKLSALASFKCAKIWQDIKKTVTQTHKNVLNLDLSKIKDKDALFRKMMTCTYNDFDDISKNFAYAKKAVSSESGGGSGGGAGSGSEIISDSGVGTPVMGDTTGFTDEKKELISFVDLPDNHWAWESVEFLVEKGILSGYPDNSFRPANEITRAEFIKMIVTAFEISGSGNLPFDDVAEYAWYREAIESAYTKGIIKGVGERSFAPDLSITREDACVIIYRIIREKLSKSTHRSFIDADEISPYAKDAVESLLASGIIEGTGANSFSPKAYIDRQSASVLIKNCINI